MSKFSGFIGGGGAVSRIVAGTGVILSPAGGTGVVTINTTSGANIMIVDGGLCSVIRYGISNSAYGSYAVAVGGQCNASNGNYSFIGGGFCNTNSVYSSIVGGQCNHNSCTSSFIGGGQCNTTCGEYSSILGGLSNATSASYSSSNGLNSCAYLYGQVSNANGSFSSIGDAQNSNLIARTSPSIASASTSILSLDGTGVTNLITPIGSNRAWNVFSQWIAVVTSIFGTANGVSVGDIKSRNDSFFYKVVNGVGSISNVTTLGTANDLSMAFADIKYSNSSGSLGLTFTGATFTGGGIVAYKVVSKLQITEIAW